MRKLKRHFVIWNYWRKHNVNGKLHHVLVLLGLRDSITFKLEKCGFYGKMPKVPLEEDNE